MIGPSLPISQELHEQKYRQPGESYREFSIRIADALKDSPEHFEHIREMVDEQRFLFAGRSQAAVGAARRTTPFNCFVMGSIPDSMSGIMRIAGEAAETMRLGGGVGYDFSTIRPNLDLITTINAPASGPISFMNVFDALCRTIMSAGVRRGAMMAVLRVDHPDIEEFIRCKQNGTALTQFNISVGITDEFMEAVQQGGEFPLVFNGRIYKTLDARALWHEIMQSNWDWAEPGVLFLDTINRTNNLWYCEHIAATNPCAEQPLPPYGACLLGSFNLVKYLYTDQVPFETSEKFFNLDKFCSDIFAAVRAVDNIIDQAIFPLREQEIEAKTKRRMGLGVTGLANCLEAMGHPYGSDLAIYNTEIIMSHLRDNLYMASVQLAKEKGAFPLFDVQYLEGEFIQTLPEYIQKEIAEHGIRNSHLISIAPTGTISLIADNVSSGCEPVFALETARTIQGTNGVYQELIPDYAYAKWGTRAKVSDQCTIDDHLNMLLAVNKYVDSSVSKTCNVGEDVTWEEFQDIYMRAWKGGAKGCTTFRPSGKRYGILNAQPRSEENEGAACFFDPDTGQRTCE